MSAETACTDVYIGLGSNLDEPAEQIRAAVEALKKLPESHYLGDSGLFLSKPLLLEENKDQASQDDYFNAVALIKTKLEPLDLLEQLQAIENTQGRVREYRWAPRTIDLDILLYGQEQRHEPRLTLPHPGVCQREFVLYPLLRLCEKMQRTDLNIPGVGALTKAIKTCPENELKYVGELLNE